MEVSVSRRRQGRRHHRFPAIGASRQGCGTQVLRQAIERNRAPEKVTIDKCGSNVAPLEAINAERRKPILVRQVKHLNNIVEQDHRGIKRRTRPMLGFKYFRCARILLSGIELMHMIRKDR